MSGTKRKISPNVTEADNDQHDGLVDFGDLTDPEKPKCLLCQRQFKEVKQLQRHTEQSALHKVSHRVMRASYRLIVTIDEFG